MPASEFFSENRLAGILLILAFILFAIGATLPIVGEKGNVNIFTLPPRDYLLAIAGNVAAWRWGNIVMGAAIVALLAGLTALTTILERADEQFLARLGLVGFLLAAILWVIFSAFRAVVTVAAAQEMAAGTTGAVPGYYEALHRWAFALFSIYAVLAYLALAAFGGSLLQAGIVPAWAGWATILFSIGLLALHLILGDTLPAFHYIPGVLIGILLLRA
jgi:hypothetical protein